MQQAARADGSKYFSKGNSLVTLMARSWKQLLVMLLAVAASAAATHYYDIRSEHRSRGTRPLLRSGPWGDLQEWDIRVEQPLEYVGLERMDESGPSWNFGTMTEPAVLAFLRESGCTDQQAQALLQTRSGTGSGDFVLRPREKELLSLSREVRSKLYLMLAGNPANRFQANPYYIPNGDFERLFDEDRLPVDVDRLIEGLLYTRNGYTYFSDPEIVLIHLRSPAQKSAFIQSLTSMNAVLLRVLVRPGSDLDKPINYWALSMAGVYSKDLRPLLEAQERMSDGGSVSILYFLPPMVRDRLYTTPLPPGPSAAKMPDCHWSALNYFLPVPDPKMGDNDYAASYILQNFYEIGSPTMAGDLVLLLDRKNDVIHSAVHLADDVVFTKNGINFAQPWILMREKDLRGHFSALEAVKTVYYRRKGK